MSLITGDHGPTPIRCGRCDAVLALDVLTDITAAHTPSGNVMVQGIEQPFHICNGIEGADAADALAHLGRL